MRSQTLHSYIVRYNKKLPSYVNFLFSVVEKIIPKVKVILSCRTLTALHIT